MAKPNFIELPGCAPIAILHEDRSVIAIDKPAGWMLVPLSWQRTQREAPAALARWGQCWQEQGPPGGESARALLARVACWWQACLPGLPRTALVVGHAGSLRALLCQLGGQPAGALFECAVDCAAPFGLRR